MRLKCIGNNPKDAKRTERYLGKGPSSNLAYYPLTIGGEYVVYAIATIEKNKFYLILDDDQKDGEYSPVRTQEYEPVWYDSSLFEIVDSSLDPEWRAIKGTMWTRWRGETKSFPEFVKNGRRFYADILDGDIEAIKVFSSYIKKYGEG